MNEELKGRLDENGKLKISDDMSEELKEVINYLNENNVDITQYNPNKEENLDVDGEEDEEYHSVFSDLNDSSDSSASDTIEQTDDLEEDDEEADLDGLEDMF